MFNPFQTSGDMSNLLSSIFGSTPTVPTYQQVDLGQSQKKSIAANQAALPAAETLTATANAFSQSQISQMLNQQIPGFSQDQAQIGSNISSELQGKLPGDVVQAVQSSAAAQSLAGGYGSSGMFGNLLAKDLGLTSLQLMGQGQSAAESWSSTVDKLFQPGQIDVSSMFITPQQQFQSDTTNAENQWNQQWLSNQVAAQPDPVASGIFDVAVGLLTGGITGLIGGGAAAAATALGKTGGQAINQELSGSNVAGGGGGGGSGSSSSGSSSGNSIGGILEGAGKGLGEGAGNLLQGLFSGIGGLF